MLFENQIFKLSEKPNQLNKNQELYYGYLNNGTSVSEMLNILMGQGWLLSFVDLVKLIERLANEKCFTVKDQELQVQSFLKSQGAVSAPENSGAHRSLTLSEISFLRNLKPEVRQVLLQKASRHAVPKGSLVIKEGDRDRDLYAVTKGILSISRAGKFLAQIAPGVCFGEAGFFLAQPRTASVMAAVDAEILKIPWQPEFDQLMNQKSAQNLQIRFWIQHALSQSSLFKSLPTECFDFLSMIGKVFQLKPGQTLIAEGQSGTSAYLIVQGEFSVSQNQKLIRSIKQGDFVGEVGLMKTGGKRTATVKSETPSLVLEIPQNEFYSMLGQNILIGYQLELLANERLLADQRRQS